jgi:tetratricopeptide (TPR) repeat protein
LLPDPESLTVQHNLALVYGAEGDHDRAARLLRRLLAHQPDVHLRLNLAVQLQLGGRYAEAEQLYREVPESPAAVHNLASLYRDQGRLAEAEKLSRLSLNAGGSAPSRERAMSLSLLGVLLYLRGERSEAEKVLSEALIMQRSILGDTHPDTEGIRKNLNDVRKRRKPATTARRQGLIVDIRDLDQSRKPSTHIRSLP